MRSIAVICVRALGAYLFFVNLTLFSTVVASQLTVATVLGNLKAFALPPLVTPLVFMVVSIMMIALSKSLARLLTAGLPEPVPPASDAKELLQLGTAIIGLFFVASAVPIVFEAAWVYFAPNLSAADRNVEVATRVHRAATALAHAVGSVAIGWVFIWMARPIFARRLA